jgi:hypothetical protein
MGDGRFGEIAVDAQDVAAGVGRCSAMKCGVLASSPARVGAAPKRVVAAGENPVAGAPLLEPGEAGERSMTTPGTQTNIILVDFTVPESLLRRALEIIDAVETSLGASDEIEELSVARWH